MDDRLWAKSWDENADGPAPPYVFLPGHLADVHASAVTLLDATGDEQLTAFGLDPAVWRQRFSTTVCLAAVCHDLGKANDHFIGMVRRSQDRIGKLQGLRHEWVTYFLMQYTELRNWLSQSLPDPATRESDWLAALWAVTGHHPAFGRPVVPLVPQFGEGLSMQLLTSAPQFTEALNVIRDAINLPAAPSIGVRAIDLCNVIETITSDMTRQGIAWRKMRDSTSDKGFRGFVAAVKNCVVAADIAGSALPPINASDTTRRDLISSAFERRPSRTDLDEVISDRLRKPDGTVASLRPFQQDVATHAGAVTLVKAGCGSGKTLAAYHWARERHPGRRLFICYPTTGTATEGFRDYVFDENDHTSKVGAKLFHSRSGIDESLILGVNEKGDGNDVLARIDSLKAWETPVVVCTVDLVLGLMTNLRRGLYAWPALAGAIFVFDEIHAFDDLMFGKLLRFLTELRTLPALLMTASLPSHRLEQLKQTVRRARGEELVEIGGPEELETLPRYFREQILVDDLVNRVEQEMDQPSQRGPGRVLCVCNTVNRAIAFADRCHAAGLTPIIYHSRFRYGDRVQRHKAVIERFRSEDRPALAICTQVAEMSLDLSATLLITDRAPIPALIQRLGRLNRRARTEADGRRPFIVVDPTNEDGKPIVLPYKIEQFEESTKWLDSLPQFISQRDLVEKWQSLPNVGAANIVDERESSWIDGGPKREVKQVRDSTPGLSVVLERDVSDIRSHRMKLAEAIVPVGMPRGNEWKEWDECCGIPVVPDAVLDYDPERGARWRVTLEGE